MARKNLPLFSLLLCVSVVSASNLREICPKSFQKKPDGLCYYDIRYLSELPKSGLQKPFQVYHDGFSPKVIDLGRLLFFDPILSLDKNRSCAHCHRPDRGLSDGLARSVGRDGQPLSRSAPTLWNVAFSPSLFWDGRAKSLESQLEGPLFSENEMGQSPKGLERELNAIPAYRELFRQAFGVKRISTDQVKVALATFERTLVSFESRFDKYVYGEVVAFTSKEETGFRIFRSFVTRCTECHTPPLFTHFQSAIIGVPDPKEDRGVGAILGEPKLDGAFRVPTLRNIARTAPYMHSGSLLELGDVVHFYNLGAGRGVLGKTNPFIHWHIREMGLSVAEEASMVAFLGTLTDESNLPEIPNEVPSGISLGREGVRDAH